MTTILIRQTKAGDYLGFTCTGHAGYAQAGEDIVCAALSVLSIHTVNAMEAQAGQKMNVISNEGDGVLDVSFSAPANEKTILFMDAYVSSLKNIAAQYGRKYVRLKFEEV